MPLNPIIYKCRYSDTLCQMPIKHEVSEHDPGRLSSHRFAFVVAVSHRVAENTHMWKQECLRSLSYSFIIYKGLEVSTN